MPQLRVLRETGLGRLTASLSFARFRPSRHAIRRVIASSPDGHGAVAQRREHVPNAASAPRMRPRPDRPSGRDLQWLRRWLAAPAGSLPGLLARALLLPRISAFMDSRSERGLPFARAVLDHLRIGYHVPPGDLARIPARGALLVAANHPLGGLDALVLLDAIGRVRRDVQVVANDVLQAIHPLDEVLLPVRVLGGKPSAASVRAILAALAAGRCVLMFPAGEVARLGPAGVRDGRWQHGIVRFAQRSGAPVLPTRVDARNSIAFYLASLLFKPLGTLMLPRELFAHRRPIGVSFGDPVAVPAAARPDAALRGLRAATHALARPRAPRAVAPPMAADALWPEVKALARLGTTADGQWICAGRLAPASPLLREIGRLREATFRAVGEGTGRSLDLDRFDAWYEHIVLWDASAGRVAGAYRVARGASVLAARGLDGLYTASLFDYGEPMLARLAQGMELGRSFVVPDYWGTRSIDYLWQGIGAYLRHHPGIRYLFGAVSVSAALPTAAREQIVAHYAHFHGAGDGHVASRRPFGYAPVPEQHAGLDADTAFRVLKANLSALGASVPMLYKQYTDLCEPGGARFLAFGVDPDFGDSVDGLIEVDVERMQARKRRRYLEAPPLEMAA